MRRKIGFVVPYDPYDENLPPVGPKKYSRQLIDAYSLLHDVRVLVLSTGRKESLDKKKKHLRAHKKILPALLRCILPSACRSYTAVEVLEDIVECLSDCEYIHLEYFYLAPLIEPLKRRGFQVVISGHDSYSRLYKQRLKFETKYLGKIPVFIVYLQLLFVEKYLLSQASTCYVVSRTDLDYLKNIGVVNSKYVPMVVDKEFLCEFVEKSVISSKVNIVICTVGESIALVKNTISYIQHYLVDFIESCSDEVNITFWTKSDAVTNVINGMNLKNVNTIGFVTDYRKFLQDIDILVYMRPYGAGAQTRLLEAMLAGTVIVAQREILLSTGVTEENTDYCWDTIDEINVLIHSALEGENSAVYKKRATEFVLHNHQLCNIVDVLSDGF